VVPFTAVPVRRVVRRFRNGWLLVLLVEFNHRHYAAVGDREPMV